MSLIEDNSGNEVVQEIELLMKRSSESRLSDLDLTMKLVQEIIDKASEAGLIYYEVIGHSRMALLLATNGQIKVSYSKFRRAVILARQNNDNYLLAKVYNTLSMAFSVWEDIGSSIKYIQKAIELTQDHPDQSFRITMFNNLGLYNLTVGNPEEGILAFLEELKIKEKTGNTSLVSIHLNVGRCYLEMGKYDLAIACFSKADADAVYPENEEHILTKNVMIGKIFNRKGQFDEALAILEKAQQVQKERFPLFNIEEVILKELSITYSSLGKFEKAFIALKELSEMQIEGRKFHHAMSFAEEDKLHELNELHSELSSIKTINEELELFAGRAAHDIKEPLRSIATFSFLLEKSLKEQLSEEQESYLNYIKESSKRLSIMLNDMLQFTSIGGQKKLETLHLEKVVGIVKSNLDSLIQEKNADVILEKNVHFVSDFTLMTLVLQNLVSNSIKYCIQNPKIEISVKNDDDVFTFFVKDNGIGIDDSYHESIFFPMKRLHSNREYEGVGLGLTACKKIIQSLGGTIGVISQSGKGSTFWFSLPQ